MTEAKSAWNEAGDRLQSLGAALKQHYDAQRPEDAAPAKDQVSDAFKKVGDALQGAFDALGAAAKDPAVKEDVKATGKSVADAVVVTFNELSDDLRKAFDKRKGDASESDAAVPTPSPTPAAAAPAATPAPADAPADASPPASADPAPVAAEPEPPKPVPGPPATP